ncbi:MAG: P-loop NTPase, partial [Rhizobiaceae bacterium]
FTCPHCGENSNIFGHGGAEEEARRIGVPFIGHVPLHMDIREKSDAGPPVVVSDSEGPHARIYKEIAEKVWSRLGEEQDSAAAPAIVFD